MPALDESTLAATAIELLAKLVEFDTTSRHSNLKLIAFVETYLARLNVSSVRMISEDGRKANLYATLGPLCGTGVILSGHTDVVPVDGQNWSSDPFRMVRRGDRLFGRGTCDMKGFIACALAAAPLFASPEQLKRPIHLALSYDEEVGCVGAPAMIGRLSKLMPRPSVAIIGEPTDMAVVGSHKGGVLYEVKVRGHAAHSSLPHLGLSANMMAVRLMRRLVEIAQHEEDASDRNSAFEPPFSTLSIGKIHGGTASNILAEECVFSLDLRTIPGRDRNALLKPFFTEMAVVDAEARQRFPLAGVTCRQCALVPALSFEDGRPAEPLARMLTHDSGPRRAVAFGSEAGQFQEAGFSTVICGPGSINQAHQPDEFVTIDQLHRCAAFMLRLAESLG
ncbi:acetylornithine deacetylase [Bradyrhizobium tropiciagri]|uniref:acetylornithine deacetylase n=1 Tax=Bradyrhizobium tropiciagri TaxID=312253 RepID=UPI001BA88D2C|nr:acetylornithine deacetylase [Bradyrhizobium tropiciagri]MBR0896773.1 acetylornithine deacetylase [Bradyrhizobium tropiciagri]